MRNIGKNNRSKSRQPGLRGNLLRPGLNTKFDQNFRKDRGDPYGASHFLGFRKNTIKNKKPQKMFKNVKKSSIFENFSPIVKEIKHVIEFEPRPT